ncbi:tRNA 4-thiouridine(8) synthase ThiI [Ornithinibacillus gellani]|uniref:tRNA uracil 4-sulfurtransferase ThiI n=1 Tax=Ornithinibacillus gellani TaxID=2293253 RepID=UPI000F4A864E|nr:tRNA uracil 4-sulfurtransferase ThiI [Ornithinibacillus gellani]TQS76286.1 tRNA 4-thiouridine(8) synthase ThiI [Ornithinibacillus gellani]
MEFDHLLIRYGEIALKGKNQKKFLVRLQENIQHALKDYSAVKVKRTQGRMFVLLNGQDPEPIMERCQHIFGIHSFSLAIKVENDLNRIKEAALYALKNANHPNTFKVTVRRVNKGFPYRSQELLQELGAHLLMHTDNIKVDVHHPDVEVKVEIRAEGTYITSGLTFGLGGLPVRTGGKTLLLLSGGIDSPVAGFLAMKRGVEVEAVHFHSPPFTSERAKQKVIDLAEKLTYYGYPIKIHLVPFTKLQQKIYQEIPESYAITVMRRMMMRISEAICRNQDILSITTGESLGQVASQTMESMNTINEVTNYPILRPLIAMDKDDIIRISKQIDTYDISIRPFEDCCTIFVPKAPKTNPKRSKVNYFEDKFDFTDLLEETMQGIETIEAGTDKQEEAFRDLL